jgi:hypothetical protein
MRTNHQVLSEAVRHENDKRDNSLMAPNAVIAKMQQAEMALQEASIAVSQYYRQCSPEQQQRLDHVELRLHHAMNSQISARQELNSALPLHRNTLSKDGLSQFNAAARGDTRSLEAQPRPKANPEIVPIRASRGIGEPTSLDQQQGTAVAKFESAVKGHHQEPVTQLASEQVENSRPHPQPRPSLEMAAAVDRIEHAKAKHHDADRAKALNEVYGRIAERLERQLSINESREYTENLTKDGGIKR